MLQLEAGLSKKACIFSVQSPICSHVLTAMEPLGGGARLEDRSLVVGL